MSPDDLLILITKLNYFVFFRCPAIGWFFGLVVYSLLGMDAPLGCGSICSLAHFKPHPHVAPVQRPDRVRTIENKFIGFK